MKFPSINRIVLLLLLPLLTSAQQSVIPEAPNPPRLVNDLAGILSSSQVADLESRLVAFNDTTSNQIAVVIVPTLGGYEISDFSFKLGKAWGIGREQLNNGILVLIKPKSNTEYGEAFIASGKGLEGAIPDAICYEIVNREMIPYFKNNDYYGGISAGTNTLMALAAGEINYKEYSRPAQDNLIQRMPLWLVILLIFIFILIISRMSGGGGYTMSRGGYYRGRGFFGGFGGGSFGGGSGGFGGFGGGSFGGGGAGGRW